MVSEMSDEQFEKRFEALVSRYADIIKKGFPEKELAKWNEKVDKLPPIARGVVRKEVEISNSLKDALMGRKEIGHPRWREVDNESGLSR